MTRTPTETGTDSDVTDRMQALLAFTPRGSDPVAVDRVRSEVVALVWPLGDHGAHRDRNVLGAAYKFALWYETAHGRFTADVLTIGRIEEFRRQCLIDLTTSSEASFVSWLRTLARGHNLPTGRSRRSAQDPYTWNEWHALVSAAATCPESEDATTLLALAGAAGLRGTEIARAEGWWVEVRTGRTLITVPDTQGVARTVPVAGTAGEFLAERARTVGDRVYLFRPDYRRRDSAASQLIARLGRTEPRLRGFSINRARHRWIQQLLAAPIPFTVVCALAGLNRGSNLANDLVALQPTATVSECLRALDRAHMQHTQEPA